MIQFPYINDIYNLSHKEPYGLDRSMSRRCQLDVARFTGTEITNMTSINVLGSLHTNGRVTDASDKTFDHDADTFFGNSGSGVYLFIPASNFMRIYGVHTGAYDYFSVSFPDIWNSHTVTTNVATRINEVRFKLICGWMASPQVC